MVVDDQLAFCGGIDLSRWRWDTSAHAPDDARRTDPDGDRYPPFHDVMMLVEGPVAAALGDLARDRWERSGASAEFLAIDTRDNDVWPNSIDPLWTGCDIGIARTFPRYQDHQAVHEVEKLYVESIRAAREYVYIENQYFTSRAVADALAERLAEPDGPDVLLVLPRHTGGWLEQVTMDEIRTRRLRQLGEADHHDRLLVCYPHQHGLASDECISVHAKVMLADDRFLRIGSANTSNRSMGLDSECDLALLEDDGDRVARVLHRLLSEHLDCEASDIAGARAEIGSLTKAVNTLRSEEGRSLRRIGSIKHVSPDASLYCRLGLGGCDVPREVEFGADAG